MSTKPFAPDEEARGVKGLVEEHTASAGDSEAGDREAGDREAGAMEAGDRESGGSVAGDREAGGREAGDMEEHCLTAGFTGTIWDTALAIVAAATAAVANARRVFPLAGGRERAAVAAR